MYFGQLVAGQSRYDLAETGKSFVQALGPLPLPNVGRDPLSLNVFESLRYSPFAFVRAPLSAGWVVRKVVTIPPLLFGFGVIGRFVVVQGGLVLGLSVVPVLVVFHLDFHLDHWVVVVGVAI